MPPFPEIFFRPRMLGVFGLLQDDNGRVQDPPLQNGLLRPELLGLAKTVGGNGTYVKVAIPHPEILRRPLG